MSNVKTATRRRGRPAQVNLSGPQTVISSHCKGELKLALMEEANASNMSLSLYVALALGGLSREERMKSAKDAGGVIEFPKLADETVAMLQKAVAKEEENASKEA